MPERIGFINPHIHHQVPRLRMYEDVPRLARYYILLLYIIQKTTLNSAWIERAKVVQKSQEGKWKFESDSAAGAFKIQ